MFHPLNSSLPLPTQLNNPFDYEPHPLCRLAARQVCCYIDGSPLREEVMEGKMLGVLVCRSADGQVGFLAAYSGQIGGRADWPWFVPAVFDYLQPNGYFKQEEACITAINAAIAQKETDSRYNSLKQLLNSQQEEARCDIDRYRDFMAEAKARRDSLRNTQPTAPTAHLIRESQHQKAELRRLKERWRQTIAHTEQQLLPLQQAIDALRQERRQRSDALQRWLFDHFVMVNANGHQRTLTDIFSHTPQATPPAGAGECCAPKLLQYAFLHHFEPLAIAEFWQGASPRMEVRHHGHYYPACRGKCKPILEWMIVSACPPRPAHPLAAAEGVAPLCHSLTAAGQADASHLSVLTAQHSFLVIYKPPGLLSVPGLTGEPSVQSLLDAEYGQVYMVHRLDQDTSGLMVVARTLETYHHLQQQFLQHEVKKKYIALLNGVVNGSGTVSLPLRPDPLDRPRQVVDHAHGKEAVTRYEVLGHDAGRTLVALFPLTGRTHQLRMHCAHPEGLAAPIVGDRLYGNDATPQPRLCLHAAELHFLHPDTRQPVDFSMPSAFL